MVGRSIQKGAVGAAALFAFYLAVVSGVSDWAFAKQQLAQFWPYVALLAAGFGIQVGLYAHLRSLRCLRMPTGTLAASSATSTLAMVSCCAHYLVSLAPVVGMAGFVSAVDRYQVELFQAGLVFSTLGILYMARQVRKLTYDHET